MNIIYFTINEIFGICLGLYFKDIAFFVLIIYLLFIILKRKLFKIIYVIRFYNLHNFLFVFL